ncbi:DUF1054 family protein [Staphylococcus equorum]
MLETVTSEKFYPRNKHARRKLTHQDTWVAFATVNAVQNAAPFSNSFLFENQLFVMYGIMHETKDKAQQIKTFEDNLKR